VRGPNFTKLDEDIRQSFIHKKFVSAFGHLAAFSKARGSKLSDVENDAILNGMVLHADISSICSQ